MDVTRRLALVTLAALSLLPSLLRLRAARPGPARACAPEGRGAPPRAWIGCAGDEGPRRDLTGRERLAVGLPLDVNGAAADDLALVPGLTGRVAAALVDERARGGPFASVNDLLRVRGIGPARLEHARPYLSCGP